MRKLILGLTAACLCALTSFPTLAGPKEDGDKAYDAGRYSRALIYYSQAGSEGNLDAMFRYAYMAENGLGAPKNMKAAKSIYEGLATKGYAPAIKKLEALKKPTITSANLPPPKWVNGKWGQAKKDGKGSYKDDNGTFAYGCSNNYDQGFVALTYINDGMIAQIVAESKTAAFSGGFVKGAASSKSPDVKHVHIYPKKWKKAWLELEYISADLLYATVHEHALLSKRGKFHLKRCS